jgi:hypothetical protein
MRIKKKNVHFWDFSFLTTWDKIFVMQNEKKMREQIKYGCIMMFIEFYNNGKG